MCSSDLALRPRLRSSSTALCGRGSFRLSREHPFLRGRLAVAHHGERAVEALTAHHAAPHEHAVLRALGLRLEGEAVPGGARLVRGVAAAVRLARARVEAPIPESDGLGVARALAALEHHAFEGPAVELHTVLLVVRKHGHAAPRPRGPVWAGLRTCS